MHALLLFAACVIFFLHMQDEGYQFHIRGEDKNIRGTIAYFSADNLGAQYVGGFKQGSKAHRKCRECMAKNEEIQTKVDNYLIQFCNCKFLDVTCRLILFSSVQMLIVCIPYYTGNCLKMIEIILCNFCSFVKTVLFFGQEKVMIINVNVWIRMIILKRHMV